MKTLSKKRNDSTTLMDMRNNKVVKSNNLIQKHTHSLTMVEQKILLFLISQIKPNQETLEPMTFDIIDFCEVCGIDHRQGVVYGNLKKTLLDLSNNGFWGINMKGNHQIMRWVKEVEIIPRSGQIEIELDKNMEPFLLQLKDRYTQYDLIYTLGMKSKYSIRLYELLKSYQRLNETAHFSLERFKELVGAEYREWYDIRRRVIEPALKEINKLTDVFVAFTPIKRGRSIAYVDFDIMEKTEFSDKVETRKAIARELDRVKSMKPD